MKPVFILFAAVHALSPAWNDTFQTYDDSLWIQMTDIEHCNDGACFLGRVDHLAYGDEGVTLTLNQSPCNATSCCVGAKCAQWASGKLQTVNSALYGTYEIRAQPAHTAGGGTPPKNAFSCWTPIYIGSPHNEIAICFSGSDSTSVHFSYWFDATAHTTLHAMPWEFSAAMHTYRVVWAPTSIQFYIDGDLIQSVTGTTSTIPYTPGYSALILRPKNTQYLADSFFSALYMSYDPSY